MVQFTLMQFDAKLNSQIDMIIVQTFQPNLMK